MGPNLVAKQKTLSVGRPGFGSGRHWHPISNFKQNK